MQAKNYQTLMKGIKKYLKIEKKYRVHELENSISLRFQLR